MRSSVVRRLVALDASLVMMIVAFLLAGPPATSCVFAEPSVPGFVVNTYASVPNPERLSFDTSGILYVGNGDNAPAGVFIHRVGVNGTPVDEYGASAIFDPDGVLFDATGVISGTPGSVLVSRQFANSVAEGAITVIRPDQSLSTLFGPTAAFRNPDDMAFDRSGRLLFTDGDFNLHNILVTSAGFPSVLCTLPAGARASGIAIDPTDRIFVTASDGTIRICDAAGNLVGGAFAIGLGPNPSLAFGMSGGFGTDLYATDDNNGSLVRFDSLGNMTVIGSGFVSVRDLAFGPDGALYVSEGSNNRVLRISAACGNGIVDPNEQCDLGSSNG